MNRAAGTLLGQNMPRLVQVARPPTRGLSRRRALDLHAPRRAGHYRPRRHDLRPAQDQPSPKWARRPAPPPGGSATGVAQSRHRANPPPPSLKWIAAPDIESATVHPPTAVPANYLRGSNSRGDSATVGKRPPVPVPNATPRGAESITRPLYPRSARSAGRRVSFAGGGRSIQILCAFSLMCGRRDLCGLWLASDRQAPALARTRAPVPGESRRETRGDARRGASTAMAQGPCDNR